MDKIAMRALAMALAVGLVACGGGDGGSGQGTTPGTSFALTDPQGGARSAQSDDTLALEPVDVTAAEVSVTQ